MNKTVKYICPKCGSGSCSIFPIRTSGTLASSLFNIQNKKFTAVVCSTCRYTEFYNMPKTKTKELFGLEKDTGWAKD
jgi:uncharacterized protein